MRQFLFIVTLLPSYFKKDRDQNILLTRVSAYIFPTFIYPQHQRIPMKPRYLTLLLPLILFSCKTRKLAQPASANIIYKAPANFRIVGYLIGAQITNGQASNFDVSRVNYLNVFFNKPGWDGKFRRLPHLDSIVTAAHSHHVKVLATIGNALDMSLLADSCSAGLIDSMVKSVADLKLDGIDVDLEGKSIDKDYEGFVTALAAALKPKGLLLTAAIATWESPTISDKALACFDCMNIMTYDATGPWNIKEPGPHSPYAMAVADLDFWTIKRHIPKEKLDLGLPFYGYGFEPLKVSEYTYTKVVSIYPGSEQVDSVIVTPANIIYYNGIPTIKKKTAYALQNAGGVMIWELMSDAGGPKSLLNAVDEVANQVNK
jgi:chitinase